MDNMTRAEAEREEAAELLAWAAENDPALIPDDPHPDDRDAVLASIRLARDEALRASRPAFVPDPRFADIEEPF